MSLGAMYICFVGMGSMQWSQDKHAKNMHRAADSTGFDTCSYTHTPDKSQRYHPIQVYLWDIPPQSIDKSVLYSIMITAGKHGIQSMQG